MTYVLSSSCSIASSLSCSPCGFCPVSPLNCAYVRFLGPVSPQKLGQVSSSLTKTGSPCPLLRFFLKEILFADTCLVFLFDIHILAVRPKQMGTVLRCPIAMVGDASHASQKKKRCA